jgi:pyridoxamine 5'-phosphate oxidase
MEENLSDFRKNYQREELRKKDCPENPLELFQTWFYEAKDCDAISEANAMSISTIGTDGFPKNRVVLLKKYTWEGFIFYTNYNSEKGLAILKNPKVCLSFFWPALERQIIIKGEAEKISANLSDGYFESRPRGSRIGAWASEQSEVVENKEILSERHDFYEQKFTETEVPRPEHWGGFLIRPVSIEFWQGRPNRMHDRIRYSLEESLDWKMERLNP